MKYREFLSLTDEEIRFILTDIFHPIKIENIQREDLNPIEEAEAYQRLISEYKLKQDEVADKVSKSRVAITNALRLLKLDERVRRMVVEDKIKSGHARALLSIKDGELQYETALQSAICAVMPSRCPKPRWRLKAARMDRGCRFQNDTFCCKTRKSSSPQAA